MLYLLIGAFLASVLASFWMAKLIADTGEYKHALLIAMMGTIGWCAPVFIQVFLLAGFVTIGVQFWQETKPAFIAWIITAAAVFAISHSVGTDNLRQEMGGPSDEPPATETTPAGPTP